MDHETARRIRTQGWNMGVQACINIVCPTPHKEEERTCEEIKKELEKLFLDVKIGDYYLHAWGGIVNEDDGK